MSSKLKDKSWILPALVILVILFLYAGGWQWLPNFWGMGRHHQGMLGQLPSAYEGKYNHIPYTPENISLGAGLYRDNCVACHGEQGQGNGPAANGLNPPPANLSWLMRMPVAQDDYLFWTISEGGVQSGSAMPAFKEKLSESERWRIIQFLRQL